MKIKTPMQLAQQHEAGIAKRVGGRTTIGSGSKWDKADVKLKGVLRIECKSTQKKSFTVTRDMLDKLEFAAGMTNELPALCIRFLDGERVLKEVAVVPIHVLEELSGGR